MVGSWGRREKTGASVVSPWGDQNPLVVQPVKDYQLPHQRENVVVLRGKNKIDVMNYYHAMKRKQKNQLVEGIDPERNLVLFC